MIVDLQFVNPKKGLFRLKPTSPALGLGFMSSTFKVWAPGRSVGSGEERSPSMAGSAKNILGMQEDLL